MHDYSDMHEYAYTSYAYAGNGQFEDKLSDKNIIHMVNAGTKCALATPKFGVAIYKQTVSHKGDRF
jgi:hypothetical protein